MKNQDEHTVSVAEVRRIIANTATREYMLHELLHVSAEFHAEALREDIMSAFDDHVQGVRR